MNRLCLIVLSLSLSASALATGRLADVTIVDRETGQPLRAYYHHGEYWIAGRPGARYGIRVQNTQPYRLMAVTSVDGVNVITGATAGFNQTGYVFDAHSSFEIAGWRKSDSEIAAFEFTAVPESYAARTGRPQNVGVIGLAIYRERRPPPLAVEPQAYDDRLPGTADASRDVSREDVGAPSPATAAGGVTDKAERRQNESSLASRVAQQLGTGHGQRESSYVTQVGFERDSTTPAEIIRIRYDCYDNLVAMGVIPRARPAYPAPEPFPDRRLSYVPDP
jgi:hypothetical protein